MALQDELLDTSGALAKTIMGKAGTSTGLDPAVLQNLNTNAMETVPAQFRESQSNLATSLLRRGGGLPMGGEFLRAYGPLETAMINARSSGLRDVQLADQAERSRTFDMNNANALAAMGQANSLSTNLLDLGQREKLLTMQQDFQGKQSELDRAAAADLQAKVLANNITLADINNASASVKSLLLSSLLSAGLSSAGGQGGGLFGQLISGGGTNGTGNRGILGDLLGGGGGGTSGGGGGGTSGDAIPGTAEDLGLSEGPASTLSKIGSALVNPWTLAIGGGVAAVTAWLKSQAHHEANTIVKNIEDPFWKSWGQILPTDRPEELAALPAAQAQDIKSKLVAMNENYKNLVAEFRKGGKDEDKVGGQSLGNTQKEFQPRLDALNRAIARGA